jgi:hypothetical protein
MLQITASSLIENAVWGGVAGRRGGGLAHIGGGADGQAGDGLGGGLFVAGGTLSVASSQFTGNQANGLGGRGIGGGLYIGDGTVCLDAATLAAFFANVADTSDPDIFGPYTIC